MEAEHGKRSNKEKQMTCWEYTGKATATQQRRRCERTATHESLFLGRWRPLCARHRAMYSDLPTRPVTR